MIKVQLPLSLKIKMKKLPTGSALCKKCAYITTDHHELLHPEAAVVDKRYIPSKGRREGMV